MFVKICGFTDAESLAAAVDAGADAVGFVFAESPRCIAPAEARKLCRRLPDGIIRVAVMRHPSAQQWDEVWDEFRPDWLQTDAADLPGLDLSGRAIPLPVWRDAVLAETPTAELPRRFLFEGMHSGSGAQPDWAQARKLAHRHELILAGGLNATNLVAAISTVRPFGLDVSSGVESTPGKKSPEKIEAFIALARANGGTGASTDA